MQKSFIALVAFGLLIGACSRPTETKVPVYDIAGDIETPPVDELKVKDLRYVALDTAENALLGNDYNLESVAGDTIVMVSENKEVLLFSLADGKLISKLSHAGQGPGEYDWIEHVYVDRPSHELLIKGASSNRVNRYTTGDSLIEDIRIPRYRNYRFVFGSVNDGFNIGEMQGDDYVIHQFDKGFTKIDSIVVKDFDMGYYAGETWNKGDRSYFINSLSDTLWQVVPGQLLPLAVINRAGKVMTPEIEKAPSRNPLAYRDYIRLNCAVSDGNYMMIMVTYGGVDHMLIYRLSDGKLVNHSFIPDKEHAPALTFNWKGATLPVGDVFIADGRWYGVIDADNAVDNEGNPDDNGDLNAGIISFELE